MLNAINGKITAISSQSVIVDLGVIAVTVHMPNAQMLAIGISTTLHTYIHWNQETGPTLFGFLTERDRATFLLITSCSGMGPKIGLALIEQLGANNFLNAIQTSDELTLSKVNGIGTKKAEQLIVQLRHKVAKLIKTDNAISDVKMEQWHNIAEVLNSLHYSRVEISRTMKYLSESYAGKPVPFDQLIRYALAFLSKKGMISNEK